MSRPTTVSVTFKPSLRAVARKFGRIEFKKFLNDKIEELAFLVERESKVVTPVKTGRLRASIGVRNVKPMYAEIFPTTNYAIYVHEGTRYMRARPFMMWGAESAGHFFDEKMAKDLDVHIQSKIK